MSFTSDTLCTFVRILCQNLARTGRHDVTCGTGYHFSETNKTTLCNRSKKHKNNLQSPNADHVWPLHPMLCNYNTLFLNMSPPYLIITLNRKSHGSPESDRGKGTEALIANLKATAMHYAVWFWQQFYLIPYQGLDTWGQVYLWHKSVHFNGDTLGKNLACFKL